MAERLMPQLVMAVTKEAFQYNSHSLPEGYTIRSSLPGDEPAWEQVISATFEYESNFDANLKKDSCFSYDNVFLVFDGNRAVATAAAWKRQRWTDAFGEQTGYLHMVAVLPKYRGKHLGSAVSKSAINHCFHRGDTTCILQTDDQRLSALLTYLKMGFLPVLVDDNQYSRWRTIYSQLNEKYLGAINLKAYIAQLENLTVQPF